MQQFKTLKSLARRRGGLKNIDVYVPPPQTNISELGCGLDAENVKSSLDDSKAQPKLRTTGSQVSPVYVLFHQNFMRCKVMQRFSS